jgi:cyclohexadieny/prephenate dehydrogenase
MTKKFNSVLIIGMGLIGSSISRALTEFQVANNVYGLDANDKVIKKCQDLNILAQGETDLSNFDLQFDLVIICTPVSTYEKIFIELNKFISKPTLVTDVGSTKMSTISDFNKINPDQNISFVPFGFSKLFENRYCILTPFQHDDKALESISDMWKSIGMTIEIMDAERHDRVLAMTSHIPQLIAYSVVGTATELESHMRDEVIKYSAAGFRDFTRLAGSDPIMWRDVYQKNKNAVLEMLGRFSEDLSTYQKAIRNGDLEFLENKFNQSKKIRKEIEDIGQAGSFDPTEKKN